MLDLPDFSRIVGEIYAAALTPDDWATPLTDIRDSVGAVAGGLVVGENEDREIKSTSLPDEVRDEYAAHYRTIDYVLADVERGPIGLARDGAQLVDLHPQSEFNIDWMAPHDLQDGIFVRLNEASTPTCFLVAAPRRSDPFASAERLHFIDALVPHWQQALKSHAHLRGLGQATADVADVIDIMRHALIVVDSRRSISHMNPAATRVLGSRDGLRCTRGAVEAVRPSSNSVLQCAIERAVTCGNRGFRSGAAIACPRTSGKWAYIIHVLPLGREASTDGPALLLVIDPDERSRPPTELVRNIFGLTKAEADVAVRILDGEGLKPICEGMNLSLTTVKTHLQHVFDKTHTHRQAELVRLLLAIVP